MKIKKCTRCGIEKNLQEFTFRTDRQHYMAMCKVCIRERKRKYDKNNKEKTAARKSLYAENNKEKLKEYRKQYNQKNKKQQAKKAKESRQKKTAQKEKIKLNYYLKNKESIDKAKAEHKEKQRIKANLYYKNKHDKNPVIIQKRAIKEKQKWLENKNRIQVCATCGRLKSFSDFYKNHNVSGSDLRKISCKLCTGDHMRERNRTGRKRRSDNLTDGFIKECFYKHDEFKAKEISQELIEFKRIQMEISRELAKQTKSLPQSQ